MRSGPYPGNMYTGIEIAALCRYGSKSFYFNLTLPSTELSLPTFCCKRTLLKVPLNLDSILLNQKDLPAGTGSATANT